MGGGGYPLGYLLCRELLSPEVSLWTGGPCLSVRCPPFVSRHPGQAVVLLSCLQLEKMNLN